MAKKKKMRLGRVQVYHSYVVDLDNRDMIQEAKNCLAEDMMNFYKYNEVDANIDVVEDKTATESDIPEFLLGEPNEEID